MKFTSGGGGENGGSDYRYDRALPDEIYEGEVLDAREDMSKAQNAMVVLTFGIDGPHGGVRVDEYIVSFFTTKVEAMVHSLAPEASETWNSTGECDVNPLDLVGRSCRIKIKNEEYEGKTRPKIDKLLPIEL